MILLIDNYDSFSYNLVQLIGGITKDIQEIRVIRNDELTIQQIDALNPEAIILSPGPGRPSEAGRCIEVIQKLGTKYKILGVCLGHQAICEAFGVTVTYAKQLMHGKQSEIAVKTDSTLFAGMKERFKVARYHSLAADKNTICDELRITAMTDDEEIMAVEHKKYKIYGVQFHPESILTPDGKQMMINFLKA
ncbi:MAG: aminodeoxychorismate/anthranilate synthase component II [Lachnospiraceae bacterium]|nr:aminodeoxychorismate/anthranilate synthase component II [Lachnospiraceae bacterium]